MFDKDTVIMGGDPAPGVSIEEMKLIASQVKTEKELAVAYAIASNKTFWIADEEYDYPEGSPEQLVAIAHTDRWIKLMNELLEKIFDLMRAEGITIPNTGYLKVIKPFMEKNGYRNGSGWWIKNKD